MKRILIAILIVLGLSVPPLLWASSEADLNIFDLIMAIIENPDPIPQVHWIPLTADPNDADTRASGYRNDGRPMFEIDRSNENPLLTWAYDAGGDHDIAFNVWRKNDWHRKIEFVTSSTVDELDPRIYVDGQDDVYVTWWENDSSSRVMAVKRINNGWGVPIQLGTGRRPSVAMWDGGLVVAYERDNALGSGQEIVFARSSMNTIGEFVPPVVVATTSRTGRLDPVIHASGGVLWIDWKAADDIIAVTRLDGGVWQSTVNRSWTDPSWVGELTVRHIIEQELTDPRSH